MIALDLHFHQNSAAAIIAMPMTGLIAAPVIQALLADAGFDDDDKVVRLGEGVLELADLDDVFDAGSSRYTVFASHPVRQA